jgi:hypothetical protein
MSPCTLQKSAYAEAIKTWLCASCGAPKPSIGAIDVQIQESRPTGEPLTFVNGCSVVVGRRDFVVAVGRNYVLTDLMLGKVINASGEVVPDWVTVRGRRRLIVRGSKNVSYRRCESCGRHVYFAMGDRYLFPAPKRGVTIYESDLYGLVIPTDAINGVSLDRWPQLGIEKLQVLPSSKDSLGELAC